YIKYRDLRGANGVPDGIIDAHDETLIGRPKNNPQLMFGFVPTITWKGFDFSTLWQGAALYDSYIWGIMVNPFENLSSATKLVYKDHWTPENTNARYPRVTVQPQSHNTVNSSHWVKNSSYLRLKNIEFGYTLPRQWTEKAAMSKVRIYFAGQNLLTWTPRMKEKIDPEAGDSNGNYYFQQSVYSFGLNVTF
ncbi:MAG: TonB-dependent receptor, partial [Tannerellaceae bacterium]|nr:TonB-dependent receptor [Tannerellaceae bacterium]